MKGGVGRARRRRRKSTMEKQKLQQVENEKRQVRVEKLGKDKGSRSDGWLSPNKSRDITPPRYWLVALLLFICLYVHV